MKLILVVLLCITADAWRQPPRPRQSSAVSASLRNSILNRRRNSTAPVTVEPISSNSEDHSNLRKLIQETTSNKKPPAQANIGTADEEGLGEQDEEYRSGFVSILGNPNVGKSTLLNALLGEKLSIVSPKPQTTRHRILGVLTEKTHQLIFSDTPGMLRPAYKLQEAMMDSVRGAVGDADVILLVTDVFGEPLMEERVRDKLHLLDQPVIVVVNKLDLVESGIRRLAQSNGTVLTAIARPRSRRPQQQQQQASGESEDADDDDAQEEEEDYSRARPLSELVSLWQARLPRAEVVGVSAANRYQLAELLQRVLHHLPRGPKYFPDDTLTNRDERFFAAEIVREALFHQYQDEVPYSCEVVIQSFVDKSDGLSVIEAFVIVDKDSQKAILIGKGGTKMKALGTAARLRLEEFLGRRVFLSLRVKVDTDWRKNPDTLARFGYIESDFG